MIFRTLLFLLISVSLYANDVYKIAVLYWSMNIEGQVAMRQGLEEEVQKINIAGGKKIELVRFVAGDGEDGIERQIDQFEEAIAQKVDAIVVQPTDNAALSASLIRANIAKIPVFAYDQYISGGKLESFITSDNYQAGYLNGEYVASHFPEAKTIKLAIVEYPFVSSTILRVEGFLDALIEYKVPFEIVARYQAVEPVAGKIAGQKLVSDFPLKGSLDLVFTANDGAGVAVATELISAKRNEIHLVSIDGDPKSVEIIKNGGIVHINSAQFFRPIGAVAIRSAYDFLEGKKIAKEILIPVFPITKETMPFYTGWLGEIPKSFEKPWKSKEPIWNNKIIERN